MSNHAVWMTRRSMSSDREVLNRQLQKGLLRRILRYASPYRGVVVLLLATLILTSLLTVAQPLLFRRIIDDGVSVGDSTVVTVTALIIALLAIIDAGLGLVSRWFSAQIGEGLIFHLRTEVFDHVQRQSIAFFTRAQTGALISRLNSDVIGAQQAFTSTLSGVVGNLIALTIVLVTMFLLSWQVTISSS